LACWATAFAVLLGTGGSLFAQSVPPSICGVDGRLAARLELLQTGPSEHVFVIDTSASMVGLPKGSGNVAIFPQVKSTISAYLASPVLRGSTVLLYSFDEGVHGPARFQLDDDADVAEAQQYLNDLEAKGQSTHVYAALKQVFAEFEQAKWTGGTQAIYVFTDGRDTSGLDTALDEVLRRYALFKDKNNPFVFISYLTLGVGLDEAEREKMMRGGINLIEAPRGQVPDLYLVEFEPHLIDFGNLWSTPTIMRTVRLRTNRSAAELRLTARLNFEELSSKQGVLLSLSPEELPVVDGEVSLTLTIHNATDAIPSVPQWGCLTLSSEIPNLVMMPASIPVRLQFQPPCEVTATHCGITTEDFSSRTVSSGSQSSGGGQCGKYHSAFWPNPQRLVLRLHSRWRCNRPRDRKLWVLGSRLGVLRPLIRSSRFLSRQVSGKSSWTTKTQRWAAMRGL